MKLCKNCHKEIQDEMRYCPFCGKEQSNDYKSELNEAMAELFDKPSEIEKTKVLDIQPIMKEKQKFQIETKVQDKNEKLSRTLSRIIGVLIVAILVVLLIFVSSTFNFNSNPQDSDTLPPVVEENNPMPPHQQNEDEKNDEPLKDEKGYSIQNAEGMNISDVAITQEENQIKLTVHYQSSGAIQVSLLDASGNTQIGPFELEQGGSFYFLLNQPSQEKYTIKVFDQVTSRESTVTLSQQYILDAIQE